MEFAGISFNGAQAPAEKRKTYSNQVLDVLRADRARIWQVRELWGLLSHIPYATFNVTISNLVKSRRAIRPHHGHVQAGEDLAPIVQGRGGIAGMTPGRKPRGRVPTVEIPAAILAATAVAPGTKVAEFTPNQKAAWLRNLCKRACIAVQIDLKLHLGADRDEYLEKLERWGEKLFQMGFRAGAGLDVPPDAPPQDEVAQ